MALTLDEAWGTNRLMKWLLDDTEADTTCLDSARACDAAANLADAAHRKLMTGVTGDWVRQQWPGLIGTVCGGCPDCTPTDLDAEPTPEDEKPREVETVPVVGGRL